MNKLFEDEKIYSVGEIGEIMNVSSVTVHANIKRFPEIFEENTYWFGNDRRIKGSTLNEFVQKKHTVNKLSGHSDIKTTKDAYETKNKG
ncbi:MAG: hypothetical protein CMM04_16655 [Rhodopirellula sp.]|nr:hypothetical protein [Rhodopirellula sp.]|tara:strand:+ start:3960 stop:4226 length:267 start_codon:yes stop_codon:yes gene_type:complete